MSDDRGQSAFIICRFLGRIGRLMPDQEPSDAKTIFACAMKGAVHELGVFAAAELGHEAEQFVNPAELRHQAGTNEYCRTGAVGERLLKRGTKRATTLFGGKGRTI